VKVALVTGGATGIGAATVKALAEEKISVALQYSSSQEEAKKLSDQLNAKGFKGRDLSSRFIPKRFS